MVSLLKEIFAQAIFWAVVLFVLACAFVIPAKSTDLTDPNGNVVTLMTGFCPKTNHFGPCKVKPHMIKPKVRPFLWDKRENLHERIVVDASVG